MTKSMLNNNYLFLGGFFPQQLIEEIHINSKGHIQNAADALQKNFITGLESHLEPDKISFLTAPFIGAYPGRYKKIHLKSINFSNNGKSISILNLLFIKHFFIRSNLKKNIESWCSKNSGTKTIIIYSIQPDFIKAVVSIKNKFPKLKICQIVPDLYEYMEVPKGFLYKISKIINTISIKKYYQYIDYYVLLSKYMVSKLPIKSQPWLIIEGIFNKEKDFEFNKQARHKLIVYTGSLAKRYGIVNLIESFKHINNKEIELIICGDGDAKEIVQKAAIEDKRIIFKGNVTREYALSLQRRALLLINPRTPEGEFTKYSFPSKIMEYFASGTPTLMYKLPGIPDEYFDFCFTISDLSISALAIRISEIIEIDPSKLREIGTKAQNFVFSKKNPNIQCKKILNLFSEY
ncbi:MAG: glycosyltransferase [Melioribacteraceae bacterium]